MSFKILIIFAVLIALLAGIALAQPPGGPKGGRPGFGGPPEWARQIDKDKNQAIDEAEYRDAANMFFSHFDKNGNRILEKNELPPPRPGPPMRGEKPEGLPLFLFLDPKERSDINRAAFDEGAMQKFKAADADGNGLLDEEEVKKIRPGGHQENGPHGRRPPFDSPTARFIGEGIRFGDRYIKNSPFSAETIVENTRRLYDGSTVTQQSKGAIYRDGMGRTRREQPLENVGGFAILSESNKTQNLIFINDYAEKAHYFLDLERKVARKQYLPLEQPEQPGESKEAKAESLGKKVIEGIEAEGTRIVNEIPAGMMGNQKPILVITEKWFSSELQLVVMSRHIDPIAGEHIFKLVNIRKGEPDPALFAIPKDFRIEEKAKGPGRKP